MRSTRQEFLLRRMEVSSPCFLLPISQWCFLRKRMYLLKNLLIQLGPAGFRPPSFSVLDTQIAPPPSQLFTNYRSNNFLQVFRCNIQNLLFNTPYHLDPVCQRAVEACLEGSVKLARARDYLWFWTLIDEQIFVRSQFGPQDYWPTESEGLKPFSTCLDCIACCGILAQKKT